VRVDHAAACTGVVWSAGSRRRPRPHDPPAARKVDALELGAG
jgi:hypothetical protein